MTFPMYLAGILLAWACTSAVVIGLIRLASVIVDGLHASRPR